MVFGIFASLVTSILVARLIGPVRLGPFNYVVWLTNITSAVGSFGLPTTTRKYMADYLNLGEAGTANAVYRFALKLQILIGAAVTVVGIALVFLVGDAGYHTVSLLLVLNMAPRMIGFIPSQANNAAEKMRQNTAPALIGAGLNTVLTLLSLWLGWGLIGIASGIIASASIETVLKLRSAYRLLAQAPPVAISPDLRRRMFSYSGQGVVLMLLNVIVWDRSDMIILKALNPDVRQLSFFSTAFNLTERILLLPNAFAGSLSVTIMAQFARGQERLQQLTMLGAKYSFLIALPLLGGMACISRPMILLLYGEGFRPMIPVFAVVSLLAISKALLAPPTALLQATERQGALIRMSRRRSRHRIGFPPHPVPRRPRRRHRQRDGANLRRNRRLVLGPSLLSDEQPPSRPGPHCRGRPRHGRCRSGNRILHAGLSRNGRGHPGGRARLDDLPPPYRRHRFRRSRPPDASRQDPALRNPPLSGRSGEKLMRYCIWH
jgi:O-antigen/teichoic acid export membrane protein